MKKREQQVDNVSTWEALGEGEGLMIRLITVVDFQLPLCSEGHFSVPANLCFSLHLDPT